MIGSSIHEVKKIEITKARPLSPNDDFNKYVRDINIRFENNLLFQITLFADSEHKLKILKKEI